MKTTCLLALAALLIVPTTGACVRNENRPRAMFVNASTDLPKVKLSHAFAALKFERPLWIGWDNASRDVLYVAEQTGKVYRFENKEGVAVARLFLDLSDRVYRWNNGGHNEEGFLGLAFHPKFKENGHFYVHYSMARTRTKPRRGVMSRFTVSKVDKTIADPESERVLFEVTQPYGNHNGCSLNFGPDGFLYISLGDGGAANDPHDYGQNLGTMLAKVLRIDVDKEENGKPYAVPADNPFVKRKGALPEIWAYGLRNTWRMCFDSKTGDLIGGDVGQNMWEFVVLIKKGSNHGWAIKEGSHDFKGGEPVDPISPPLIEYSHKEGVSITGGEVYRGSRHKSLDGIYFYADYGTGRFWGLKYANNKVTHAAELLETRKPGISSFGVDADNEVFVCCFDGRIYRVEPR